MIPLMKNPFLRASETKERLAKFIATTNRFSMGSECRKFERAFAGYQGAKDAVLFNSGGSANLAIFQTLVNLGLLSRGDRVGFSSLTWSTNVMPLFQLGLEPVPVDCSTSTLNVMSKNLLARLDETDLAALFITNAMGFAGDLGEIKKICDEREILLLEDNCEALGTVLPEGKAGSFGKMTSFSFFIAHHMSTIEGGMVCTDDQDLAEMLRIVRANGWDRNLTAAQQRKWRKKYKVDSEFDAKYTFYDLGYNMRPTEITGFMGSCQMDFLDETVEARERNYDLLAAVSRENPDLRDLDRSNIDVLSCFAFPVLCRTPELRKSYLAQFAGAGVEIRPMIAGNIQNQPFYIKHTNKTYDLPGTQKVDECGFYCGNYPELTEADLEVLASCLEKY